ncbi:MAG: sulfotransferase [Rhodothermales bacterium]
MSHDISNVFIVGCPRSGTSALSWSLAQHPRMWTSAESDFLLDLFGKGRLKEIYDHAYARPDQGWLKKNEVSYEEFCANMGRGVDELFRSRSHDLVWVDSTPGYTLMADTLALLLPRARFLHIVRDGRAVVNSMLNSGFAMKWATDLQVAAETWVHYLNKGLEFEKTHPSITHRVMHDQLVSDPALTCAEILDFLGLEHDSACADYLSQKRINSSYDNTDGRDVRSVKDTARLKDQPWKKWSRGQRRTFEQVAGWANSELGYQ